mmetsp:Transcript_16898/g.25368  ORF Transcript_16898/g.25368 Transcript_16898/m.25368 type:complete len:250 (-) Transcript_16898:51-800(-)
MKFKTAFSLLAASAPIGALAFSTSFSVSGIGRTIAFNTKHPITTLSSEANDWNGEVVSNTSGGKINGCKITQVEGSMSDWVVAIDGQEADLGKFSDAIYKKITADAKKQRFQGFRPGTIPPHLQPTYMGFSIDECAKEATLEAMQQNNIRPFENARNEFEFDTIAIMPPKKKKNKKKKKKKGALAGEEAADIAEEPEPQWLTFGTFKEAISAGWKPGQTFSFVARNVKGQNVVDVSDAKPLGGASAAMM